MAIESLQKMKWPTMAFLATLAFVLWLPDLLAGLFTPCQVTVMRMPLVVWNLSGTTATLLTMLLVLVNGWALTTLAFHLNITQTRSFLTLFSYIYACSCINLLHHAIDLQLGLLCVMLILSALHEGWHRRDTAEIGLRCGLLCVLAACFIPHMLYAIPWILICLIIQGALTLRTLVALLMGYAVYFTPLLLPIAFPNYDFTQLQQQVLSPFVDWQQQLLMWQDFLQWRTHLRLYILLAFAFGMFFLFVVMNTSGNQTQARQNHYDAVLAGFFVLAMVDMNIPIAIATFAMVFTQMLYKGKKDSNRGWYFTLYILIFIYYYTTHLSI